MGAMASQITSLTIVLLNRLFRRRSKKTSKLCVTDLCAGNSPVTGEFPAKSASNAEKFPFDDVIVLFLEHSLEQGSTVSTLPIDHNVICMMASGHGPLSL